MVHLTRAQTAFDVFAIAMAALNALEQPYRQSVEIVSHFKRDGAFLFIVSDLLSGAAGNQYS